MIAVSSSGKSFRALAAYLANGRDGESQDRVIWSASRNLPTNNPELAGTFMRATASRSDRVEKPVYHLVLSCDPHDHVDRRAMERVADQVLQRLGLAEHQAVVVAHGDRQHPHVHVFVNRVHPETGKAWERWKDQPVIQQVLREQEVALGLRPVPSTLAVGSAQVEVLDHFVKDTAPAHDIPGRSQAGAFMRTQGKIGEIERDLRTYERVEDLTREAYRSNTDMHAARARSEQIDAAFDRTRAGEEAFARALQRVYRDPTHARQTFDLIMSKESPEDAVRVLREHPEQLAPLAIAEQRRAFGLLRTDNEPSIRLAAREAAHVGERAIAASRDLVSIADDNTIRRLEAELTRAMSTLYDRPEVARRAQETLVERHGVGHAVSAMSAKPEQLGELRRSPHLDGASLETRVTSASRALTELVEARNATKTEKAPSYGAAYAISIGRVEREASAGDLRRATESHRATRAQLKRLPTAPDLRQRIVSAASLLLPKEAQALKTMLTAPHLALLTKLKSYAREVLLGREDER